MRYIKERLLLFCFVFVFGLGTQSNSLHSKCVWGPKLLDLSSWCREGAQRCSTESSGSQITNQKSACVSLVVEASPGGLLMNQEALRCQGQGHKIAFLGPATTSTAADEDGADSPVPALHCGRDGPTGNGIEQGFDTNA